MECLIPSPAFNCVEMAWVAGVGLAESVQVRPHNQDQGLRRVDVDGGGPECDSSTTRLYKAIPLPSTNLQIHATVLALPTRALH